MRISISGTIKQSLERKSCTVGMCGREAVKVIQYGYGGFKETTCLECFNKITQGLPGHQLQQGRLGSGVSVIMMIDDPHPRPRLNPPKSAKML